jgi:hypothetical protein
MLDLGVDASICLCFRSFYFVHIIYNSRRTGSRSGPRASYIPTCIQVATSGINTTINVCGEENTFFRAG